MSSITDIRTGIGFDVHAFVKGRRLIIGGIEISFEKGLEGHSDADVLLHAIADALLGSLSLGDIGQHFPDTDDKYENMDSLVLLKNVYEMIKKKGYLLGNLDSVVALQKPKIMQYIPQMKNKIAEILETTSDKISIKATTTEKLGFVGREEGAAAMATVIILKK
jgi:2-C-methyl-D-erythritol 2,4-cyclodiphosphate synthase